MEQFGDRRKFLRTSGAAALAAGAGPLIGKAGAAQAAASSPRHGFGPVRQIDAGVLNQGYVETSNVNVVEELVTMIETQRAYEMNSKAISTTDQMLQYVTNNV